MTLEEMRARLQAIDAERRAIDTEAGEAHLDEEQQARWDALDAEENTLRSDIAVAEDAEARAARVAESRARWNTTSVQVTADPYEVLRHGGHGVHRQKLIDSAMRGVEGRVEDAGHFRSLLQRHASDVQWAANVIARTRPEYASAFSKLMRGDAITLTAEERAAMTVGTNTAGGFLVPTHLDPSLILTNNGTSNMIRGISRVVTLTGGANVWHGVTTAGATASWDAEVTEVSDDTPAVASLSIPVYKAQSLLQASIEAFEDIAGLESDALMILADARDRLEGAAHATGPGSTAPKGVFTAVAATAGSRVVSTTAATIGLVDIHAVYTGLPVRHRSRSAWLMNPVYAAAVKSLGGALSASYSADLTQPFTDRIMGKPSYESDDAPATQTTTALDSEILFGDFSKYVIVDKPGSTAVEFIPHLFNTSNNLPDGRRAWYMHFRSGADVADANAFRLLVDKTSA